ncbi:MAG: neuraminidase-like domain-containing protein [Waterburya sp.]
MASVLITSQKLERQIVRFEHDGISLWYGTADAPAPQETIFTETDISLTVGIQPLDASNRLEVHYRVNQGSTATLTAKPLQSDSFRRIQYFRANFPAFRAGDRVEYAVICRCAGRQVPAQYLEKHWTSIQVVSSNIQATRSTRPSSPIQTNPTIQANSVSPPNTLIATSNVAPLKHNPTSTNALRPREHQRLDLPNATLAPPPEREILYDIEINITAPTPNMEIVGTNITIVGNANGTETSSDPLGDDSEVKDITEDLEIFIQFQNTSPPRYPVTGKRFWSLTLPVPTGSANADGQLRIIATAQYRPGLGKLEKATSVTVDVDNQPPALTISRPLPDETIVLSGLSLPVPLEVTATDNRQVSEVKWSLDNQDYNNSFTLDNGVLKANVIVTETRKYTINVRAKDNFNNITEKSVTIDVTRPFTPVDPADVTGQISYLGDLLEFAAKRIKVSSSIAPSPSATDFTNIFCQRFNELLDAQNKGIALQSIHQIRISVDVLRKYLLNRAPQWQNRLQELTASEAEYRQQAYDALLRYLGTSDRELRRALIGEPAPRIALANRLGIGSEALQGLLLSPDQITEENLERIFGLADTHFLRDPFAANIIPPELLIKRRAYARATWRQQDDTVLHPILKIPVPAIDPDLVQEDELKSSTAISLWHERQLQVQNLLKTLRDLPSSNLPKFEAAINLALPAGALDQLKDLFTKYKAGNNIESQLRELFLELPPFLYLMQIYGLLTINVAVLDDEWEQTFSILVQVQKLRDAYPTWRTQEIENALSLGPDDFKLTSTIATPLELPLWRATQSARQAWKLRLVARIDQDQVLIQELKSVVDSAEAIALPYLRTHLINLIKQAANHGNEEDTAEQLTTELFIDLKSSNNQKISWVGQAIETLQNILFALRMGRLALSPVVGSNPAAGWQLDTTIPNFDEEWKWMGTYTTWRAAMGVFLFPENFLQPAMRPLPPASPSETQTLRQTQTFKELLVEKLREQVRVTRELARNQANVYLSKLKEQIPDANTLLSSFSLQERTTTEEIEALRVQIDTVFTAVKPNAAKFQDVANWVREVFYFVPLLLAQHLERSGEYLAALDWYKAVYAYTLPTNRKVYKGLMLEENTPNEFAKTDEWLLADFNPHKIAQTRKNIYTRFTIRSLAQCLIAFADDQFTQQTVESLPQARARYLEALDLLNLEEMRATSELGGKTLENSLLQSVRNHASMNLLKLRNGLNIAGLERPRQSETTIRTVTRRPTPYRYQVLIERAKQLTATAGQIEASFLATLEKLYAEQYALLKAQQDIELSRTQVQLQNLRVIEAQDGVKLAELQRDRAQIQVDYYQDLINADLIKWEKAALAANIIGVQLGILGAIADFNIANAVSSVGSFANQMASFERREQEWKQQLSLSRQDVVIGGQQIILALDHVAIAKQELQIAATQVEHAVETINFLANKFTNAELFDWMSRVLERVYAFFLQQATAIARLAEAQLAFERQEELPTFIQSDYWQAPDESSFGNSTQGSDRRGLTGSARLLQAITELDQYAFLNDRRKLQMSKTLSLAAISPAEFQRFRETGVMLFGTPMEVFDRDFPGHYLRLLRQVRTTVIALIPPAQGIRATLTNMGVSRVTINDDGFQDVEVHHGPQSVALSAPVNATGVFELNLQPELLQPFEAIGINSFWEFRLPKAANPFDFDTIADVLITFDYTALDSWDYRQQVIQRLDPNLSADRAFSFRNQFADQWYDLNNPDQTATPMTVNFQTLREDFPPNLESLWIEQVVLYFVRANGQTFEIQITHLKFTDQDSTTPVGEATSIDGIISTRRGNASSWTAMIDKSPVGQWELALANTDEAKNRFKDEQIKDILFVITYAGRTPKWPM